MRYQETRQFRKLLSDTLFGCRSIRHERNLETDRRDHYRQGRANI